MSTSTTSPPTTEREPVVPELSVPASATAPTSVPAVESPPPSLAAPAAVAPAPVIEQAPPKQPQQQPAPVPAGLTPVAMPQAIPPITVNVTQPTATPSVTVVQLGPTQTGPGMFVRALWFLFVGWWAGYLWAITALVFEWSIIGLPLALLMFNRLPKVMTLKPTPVGTSSVTVVQTGSATTVVVGATTGQAAQPFWLRAVYFVLVGWWLSFLWLNAAYFVGMTIIGLPLMFWMVNRMPAITTLSSL